LLDQVQKLREEISQDEAELKEKKDQLQKFEEARKLLEGKERQRTTHEEAMLNNNRQLLAQDSKSPSAFEHVQFARTGQLLFLSQVFFSHSFFGEALSDFAISSTLNPMEESS